MTVAGTTVSAASSIAPSPDWRLAVVLVALVAIGVAASYAGRLDVARDAAHAVDRPAAPITTFLLGYAVAKAGDDKLNEAAHALMRLSGEWDLGLHRE